MRREEGKKKELLSAIQLWAYKAGQRHRAKSVINMIMFFIACTESSEGPENYLVQATPVTPEERETQKG